jgi:cellulose synthase/poly-beta-1,6-N-acetylglucosamine synthase-like glycosyltransferase
LVGDFVRYVNRTFNPDAHISRFIWVLTPRPAATPATDTGNGSVPLVSILVRTQGERNELLTEALYSVYAQTCDDYEIIVCFHRPDDTTGDLQRAVEQTIANVPGDLLAKIRVIEARGNGRGAPLNALLERSS